MALDRASPNFGPRIKADQEQGLSLLVIHYTGMQTCAEALEHLCDPGAMVSAHLVIDLDGTVHRLVAEGHRAWHAGKSYWRGISDVNSASIGIELVNPGHKFGYEPFPDPQIARLIEISEKIVASHHIPPAGVVGHSDVAPGRKADPGELFPWSRLAKAGLGLWPVPENSEISENPWADLALIGYAIPGDPSRGGAVLEPETAEKDVIIAFQRHYLPEAISGVLDLQTQKRIHSVAEELS